MNISKAKLRELMHEAFILGKNDSWELNFVKLYEDVITKLSKKKKKSLTA